MQLYRSKLSDFRLNCQKTGQHNDKSILSITK